MKQKHFLVFEERTDEGVRTFKNGICGTIRTIEAGGDKRVLIYETDDKDTEPIGGSET